MTPRGGADGEAEATGGPGASPRQPGSAQRGGRARKGAGGRGRKEDGRAQRAQEVRELLCANRVHGAGGHCLRRAAGRVKHRVGCVRAGGALCPCRKHYFSSCRFKSGVGGQGNWRGTPLRRVRSASTHTDTHIFAKSVCHTLQRCWGAAEAHHSAPCCPHFCRRRRAADTASPAVGPGE